MRYLLVSFMLFCPVRKLLCLLDIM